MKEDTLNPEKTAAVFDDRANAAEALRDKLADAQTPGYQAEFDPEEAQRAGAFIEDALSEADALESTEDGSDPMEKLSIVRL